MLDAKALGEPMVNVSKQQQGCIGAAAAWV